MMQIGVTQTQKGSRNPVLRRLLPEVAERTCNQMPRYSVSVDDDLADWIDTEAEQRNIPKAQVIREALRAARREGDAGQPTGDVRARLDALETRVQRVEALLNHDTVVSTEDSDVDVVEQFRGYLENRPPESETAKAATVTTLRILRANEQLTTRELREAVYDEHSDAYSDPESLWQSIQRYFDELPGFQKAGYGEWQYAGDSTILRSL